MPNLFASEAMAAGYAMSRPPLHPVVIDRVRRYLHGSDLRIALDVGCGAGLSTKPLAGIARRSLGVDPAEAMLRWASRVAPAARFALGRAEELPVRPRSIDLITAAGSLDFADLDAFGVEAERVLSPDGVVVVYDFGPGGLRASDCLHDWYRDFLARYPPRPGTGHSVGPEVLAAHRSGLRLLTHERFEAGLVLERDFYVRYAMTQSNVAAALQAGAAEHEIRSWCEATLGPIFSRPQEVIFESYIAYLSAR